MYIYIYTYLHAYIQRICIYRYIHIHVRTCMYEYIIPAMRGTIRAAETIIDATTQTTSTIADVSDNFNVTDTPDTPAKITSPALANKGSQRVFAGNEVDSRLERCSP